MDSIHSTSTVTSSLGSVASRTQAVQRNPGSAWNPPDADDDEMNQWTPNRTREVFPGIPTTIKTMGGKI